MPESLASTLKQRAFSALAVARLRSAGEPRPAVAPVGGAEDRVLIGPKNSAGQGYRWARALERERAGTAATSMQFSQPDSLFAYPADQLVLNGYGAHSKGWQRRQLQALSGYCGVVVESAAPPLGGLADGSVIRQIEMLRERGVRLSLMFHGSDLRDPDAHLAAEPLSYFGADAEFAEQMRRSTRRSREVIAETGLPVLVSTPDLLSEVDGANWVPVVIDAEAWCAERAPLEHSGPLRVVHAPSSSHIKGSELIDDRLQRLHEGGSIEYRRISGVPHARMPELYGWADVVLDQFRGGPYGVAACEAMASGRIVISYVPDSLRARVAELWGETLPILDTTPAALEETIMQIVQDPAPALAVAAEGPRFVARRHSGAQSGRELAAWLDGESGRMSA